MSAQDSALEAAVRSIDERMQQRREQVAAALARHLPDFPVDRLRETFGARVESIRCEQISYGPEPPESVVPGDPWVIPKPPKGDYPVIVAMMSEAKRQRLNRLRRVRSAGKIRAYEHSRE